MSPRPKLPARTALVAIVASLVAGVGVPLAASAQAVAPAAKAKGPCGQSWTIAVPKSYAIFPAKSKGTMTVYKKPSVTSKHLATIKDPMPDGTRGVLLAVDATITNVPDWLAVWYGNRSNKAVGWVQLSKAQGLPNKYAIQLNRKYHKLALTQGTKCVGIFPIAVGKPSTPTPSGIFFVNDKIPAPNAAYGHHLLGTDADSPVYTKFDDLDAAIGIHGTDQDNLIGQSISHGCIRMHTKDSDFVFSKVTAGTPIIIT